MLTGEFYPACMIPPDMSTVAMSVRSASRVQAVLGEGPLWDPRVEQLLFLDILGGKLFSYDPQTERTETFSAPGKISAIVLRAKGGYVCASKGGFAYLALHEGEVRLTPVAAPESDRPDNRFNDGKADPFGGFWAGTMDEKEKDPFGGSWWRLPPDGKPVKLDEGFHVANGPAFDQTRQRVYFTDSARQTVFVARATENGFVEKRAFLQFGAKDGYPDGMDIDLEGNIWIAFWDGYAVRRFSPEGLLIEEIPLPTPRPTSVALVGERAFVTSARIGLPEATLKRHPSAGDLFEISLARNLGRGASYFSG